METVTRTQSVSRMANDRIYNVLWGFAADDGAFHCECRDSSCAVEVLLTPSEYVRLRDRGGLVYASGHDGATSQAVSPIVS